MQPLRLDGIPVRIWRIDLAAPADERLLSADERARADRLVIPIKRQRFIAARAGLRLILEDVTGTPPDALIFCTHAHGKPYLCGHHTPEFNLAHADDTALVAVAETPVGIDIEHERPLTSMLHMTQIAFSPQEQSNWLALPAERQTEAFYRTWTRKEALMKAHGDGFRLSQTFSIPVTDQPQTITVDGWTVRDIPLELGWVAALATLPPNPLSKSWLGERQ